MGNKFIGILHQVRSDSVSDSTNQVDSSEGKCFERGVSALFAKVLKDATDEAARRGIPYQAAEDFLLGHLTILLAVAFGAQPGGKLSDGCMKAIEEAEPVIFKEGWMENIFSEESVKASVKSICA